MATNLISRLCRAVQKFEQILINNFGRGFPPEPLCAVDCGHLTNHSHYDSNKKPFSIEEIFKNSILWAVPKKRRTVEKRLKRKFGHPKYVWKMFEPQTNILMCPNCGHDYQANHLCNYCYDKAKAETKEMQEAIQNKLGLSPIEQDVIVLYEGEAPNTTEEFWKKQRIIEMPKKRPEWFSKNLLQPSSEEFSKSAETPSVIEDVKTSKLA